MRRLGVMLLLAQVMVPEATLVAQPTSVLTRIVRSASSPLAGAEVSIDRTLCVALTDTSGRCALGGIPAGRHVVSVRRLGFAVLSTPVTFTPDDTLAARFGHFLGPEAFAHADVRLTSDVLRQLPGARLVNAATSSASWLVTGRTTPFRRTRWPPSNSTPGRRRHRPSIR